MRQTLRCAPTHSRYPILPPPPAPPPPPSLQLNGRLKASLRASSDDEYTVEGPEAEAEDDDLAVSWVLSLLCPWLSADTASLLEG